MAWFEKGKVKKTAYQEKKHVSQMTGKEKKYIKDLLKQNKRSITLSDHAKEQIEKGKVDFRMKYVKPMMKDLKNSLLEYNHKTNGKDVFARRILLRSSNSYMTTVDGKNVFVNLCVVLDLKTMQVVTAYNNDSKDNHSEINMNRYTKELTIIR